MWPDSQWLGGYNKVFNGLFIYWFNTNNKIWSFQKVLSILFVCKQEFVNFRDSVYCFVWLNNTKREFSGVYVFEGRKKNFLEKINSGFVCSLGMYFRCLANRSFNFWSGFSGSRKQNLLNSIDRKVHFTFKLKFRFYLTVDVTIKTNYWNKSNCWPILISVQAMIRFHMFFRSWQNERDRWQVCKKGSKAVKVKIKILLSTQNGNSV